MDHEKHYECLVKEFQSALNKSSITSFSSVYFGGGKPILLFQSNVDTVLLVIVAWLCIGISYVIVVK